MSSEHKQSSQRYHALRTELEQLLPAAQPLNADKLQNDILANSQTLSQHDLAQPSVNSVWKWRWPVIGSTLATTFLLLAVISGVVLQAPPSELLENNLDTELVFAELRLLEDEMLFSELN